MVRDVDLMVIFGEQVGEERCHVRLVVDE
jgi:hypothetical protein